MVTLWLRYGYAMDTLWIRYGYAMDTLAQAGAELLSFMRLNWAKSSPLRAILSHDAISD
jgi:hypothetical protein